MKRTEQTHYETIGVAVGAAHEQIHQQFKSLALQYHPDKFPNNASRRAKAERRFYAVSAAWAVLKDEQLRKQYDDRLRFCGWLCANCQGAGSLTRTKGFTKAITKVCPYCAGSGLVRMED